jgi:hypothetical protein
VGGPNRPPDTLDPRGPARPSKPRDPARPPGPPVTERTSRIEARHLIHRRKRQRRRRLIILGLMLIAGALVAVDLIHDPHGGAPATDNAADRPSASPAAPAGAGLVEPSAPPDATLSAAAVPESGPGTFSYAGNQSPVMGSAGTLQSYKVGVEKGVGVDPAAFATRVGDVLGDARSWIGGKDVRLQQVPGSAKKANFTVFLATAKTSEKMCREDGLHTEGFTSCRLASGKVVINLSRWLTAIPNYGAPLDVYQAYAINHEVGHQLGHGHEACPGIGRPAPVMQQQTLGLKQCVANAWPFPAGARYQGPPIP